LFSAIKESRVVNLGREILLLTIVYGKLKKAFHALFETLNLTSGSRTPLTT